MGDTVDFVTLMGKAHKKISAERKDCLNSVLMEDFKTLCHNETSDSKYRLKRTCWRAWKELNNLLEF